MVVTVAGSRVDGSIGVGRTLSRVVAGGMVRGGGGGGGGGVWI